jgi:V8-like Glu-specific endopeptidase
MSRTLPCRAVVAVAFLCASFTAPSPGHAAASSPTVIYRLASTPRELRSTIRFWTPARLRRTASHPNPLLLKRPTRAGNIRAQTSAGSPHLVPPSPLSGAKASSDQVADPTGFPARAVGLLVGKIGLPPIIPSSPFACSASVVNSPSASLIFTAAHCIVVGARAHGFSIPLVLTKGVFVPGFHDGQTPFGLFPVKKGALPGAWIKSRAQNENVDVGALVLGRNAAGQRVGDVVGALGLAVDQGTNQTFDAYGYPQGGPFDPEKQWHCQAPYAGTDPISFVFRGPPTMRINCDLGAGASGGGWVIGGQYLNGLSTYGYPDEPSFIYGPYFGRAVWKLYARARHLR